MIGLINHANRDSLINFKDNEYALAKNKLQNKYSSVAKSQSVDLRDQLSTHKVGNLKKISNVFTSGMFFSVLKSYCKSNNKKQNMKKQIDHVDNMNTN